VNAAPVAVKISPPLGPRQGRQIHQSRQGRQIAHVRKLRPLSRSISTLLVKRQAAAGRNHRATRERMPHQAARHSPLHLLKSRTALAQKPRNDPAIKDDGQVAETMLSAPMP